MFRRLSKADANVDLSQVLLLPNAESDNHRPVSSASRFCKFSRFGCLFSFCVGVCTLSLLGIFVSSVLSRKLFWFRDREHDLNWQSSLISGPRNGSSSDIYAEIESRLLPYFRFITISSDDWGRFSDSIPLFPNKYWKQRNTDISTASGTPWEYGTVGMPSEVS